MNEKKIKQMLSYTRTCIDTPRRKRIGEKKDEQTCTNYIDE